MEESFREDGLPEDNTAQSSQEDLPFSLDEESSGTIGSPASPETPIKKSTYGFSVGPHKAEIKGSRIVNRPAEGKVKGSLKTMDLDLLLDNQQKKGSYVDNLLGFSCSLDS